MREDLWIRDGVILNPEKLFFEEHGHADFFIDCHDAIICAGFIDVQINGGFGVDFSRNTADVEDGLQKVAKNILQHGVTSFCPTVVTSPPEIYKEVLPRLKRTEGGKDGAGNLGVHIEGPFINKDKKGAHPPQFIRSYDDGFQDILDTYHDLSNVAIVTLAPEKQNSCEVIQEFRKRGIVVSVGHSTSNLVQGESAVQSGATFITHLFNAMLSFHHRDPGLVGLLTSNRLPEDRTVFYGIIADGIHTHPAALRIAHRTHPKGLVLVTDAIAAMGMPCGVHHIGQMDIEIKNKRALIAGTDILSGSIATMNDCLRHFYKSTDCTKIEALESASLHPAQLLGISDFKGTLDYDTDADFVMLDDSLNVLATYIAGKLVWDSKLGPKRQVIHVHH